MFGDGISNLLGKVFGSDTQVVDQTEAKDETQNHSQQTGGESQSLNSPTTTTTCSTEQSLLEAHNRARSQIRPKDQLDIWLDRNLTPSGFSYNDKLLPFCESLTPEENWEMLEYGLSLLETKKEDIRLAWSIHANLDCLCNDKVSFKQEMVNKFFALLSHQNDENFIVFFQSKFQTIINLYSFKNSFNNTDLTEQFQRFKETKLVKWEAFLIQILNLLPSPITTQVDFPIKRNIFLDVPNTIKYIFENKIALDCTRTLFILYPFFENVCMAIPKYAGDIKVDGYAVKTIEELKALGNSDLTNELTSFPDMQEKFQQFLIENQEATKDLQKEIPASFLSQLIPGQSQMPGMAEMMKQAQNEMLSHMAQDSRILPSVKLMLNTFQKLKLEASGAFLVNDDGFTRFMESDLSEQEALAFANALEEFAKFRAEQLRQQFQKK